MHTVSPPSQSLTTGRVEAFSDGVFAVAITLLVFNLHTPDHPASGELTRALLGQWPSYASYAVSFLTIGIIWVNHHTVFRYIETVDRPLLFFNLLLLMAVAFIPFPTSLLGAFIQSPSGADSRIAAIFYGATMTAMSIGFFLVWGWAVAHPPLLSPHLDVPNARATMSRFFPGTLIYALATILALVSATISLLLCAALAIYYVFNQLPIRELDEAGDPSRAIPSTNP